MSLNSTPITKSSLLPSSRTKKSERKTSGEGPSKWRGDQKRRRNSESVAGHSADIPDKYKLPSWLVPPSVYKPKSPQADRKRSSRRKGESALTDSEDPVTEPASTLRSSRSMRNLFSRPSTSTLSSTRSKAKGPFSPSIPAEIWVLIFQHATSPANPFIASSALCPLPPSGHSFLHFPHSQGHFLKEYRRSMRIKCDLTLVCKLWWAIGQEVLFEFVWLTKAKEASLLARLLSDVSMQSTGLVEEPIARPRPRVKAKGKEKARDDTIYISTTTSVEHSTPASAGTYTFPYDTRDVGRHIRRLHIETNSLDRCSPQDLLTILRHAPALQVFSDNQSIRRTSGFSIFPSSLSSSVLSSSSSSSSGSTTVISTGTPGSSGGLSALSGSGSTIAITAGAEDIEGTYVDPPPQHQQQSDEQVLTALISAQRRTTSLRRLSWTNYEYEAGDFAAGMAFYSRVVAPKLSMVSAHLEYLELTLCAKDLMRGMTGQGGTGGGFFESLLGAGTTVTTTTTTSEKSLSHSVSSETLRSIQSAVGSLSLPNLTGIKLTLDNVTCLVISTWDLPAIKNVSLIASDFSYANEGFASFFEAHGYKIVELELGHSTGAIEEFWLTAPPHHGAGGVAAPGTGWRFGSTRVPLAEWCPHLHTFICSADAEWDWENPDWIAPHVLLPAHPNVQVIGVRDIEKRLIEALGRVEYRDRVAIGEGRRLVGLDEEESERGVVDENDPFFALAEQLGSLVKSDAFPALKYVRDLSPQSRVIRETGRVKVKDVEMRSIWSLGSWWDEDEEEVEVEERQPERQPETRAVPTAYPHGRYSSFGQGGFVALWTAMVQNMSSASNPTANPSLHMSAPSTRTTSTNAKSSGNALKKLLERQQGIRVLRFWKNVLGLFKGREGGVYLEDCDGYNVTLARLRRAAAEVGR